MRTAYRILHALLWSLVATLASAFPIGPYSTNVYEYQNEITGQYLLLGSARDVGILDRNGAGPGWSKTGHYFTFWSYNPLDSSDRWPVCRFYTPINGARFSSANPGDCAYLAQPGSGWIQEFAEEYRAARPEEGACAAARHPIYRLYNNKHAVANPNHRYTGDAAVKAEMIARGWVDEGIVFCALNVGVITIDKIFTMQSNNGNPVPVSSLPSCEAFAGTCIATAQVAPLPTVIHSWQPPSYVTRNLLYPWDTVAAVTGLAEAAIQTDRQPGTSEVLEHTFLQAYPSGGPPIGIHINAADRLPGVYASVAPMRTLPATFDASGDDRLFPWRGTKDRELVFSATLSVRTLRRTTENAHAYAVPVLRFVDKGSGRSFYLTLQAVGTLPAGDYVGPDAATRTPIVSTAFSATSAFGRRVAGEFTLCNPVSNLPCLPQPTLFSMALRRADLQKVVDRARSVDAALSASVSDYFLASMRLHAETFLDARLGMTLHSMQVTVTP